MTATNATLTDADVIINAVEINDRHGVGILVQRIFQDRSNIISIRALDLYGGEQSFGAIDYLVSSIGCSRSEIFAQLESRLAGHTIKRILCIPYHPEEIFMALSIQELFGAQICTYLMDDRNILVDGISDELMAELLDKSRLRLAISTEMCDIYTSKFGQQIFFAPPVISADLVDTEISTPLVTRGAIVGNIWSAQWLQQLRQMTKAAEVQLDWYGNSGADWNMGDRSQLIDDGITERGFLPTEAEVIAVLRTYPYVVIPSGTLDERDDNQATSWLSLPSRIPFILATSNTPAIVLGNRNTAAARFVERVGIGTVSDYDPASFQQAVSYITQPQVQQQCRQNATQIARLFVNRQMDEWIWQSLAVGKPIDNRFDLLSMGELDYLSALATCMTSYRYNHRLQSELKASQHRVIELQSSIESSQLNPELVTVKQQSIELRSELAKAQQQSIELRSELVQAQQQSIELQNIINSMKQTKFWRLRDRWFKVKKILKITQ